jgi:hypothetical protein
MKTYNLDHCPEDSVVATYLDRQHHFRESSLKPQKDYAPLVKFEITGIDFTRLVADTKESMRLHGLYNYRLGKFSDGNEKNDPAYLGMGLTYNPQQIGAENVDPHQQVQGNDNPGAKGYQGTNPFTRLEGDEALTYSKKNTHYDTMSFCHRTPGSRYGALGDFCDSFKRSMIRSSIRTIFAEWSQHGAVRIDGQRFAGVNWHTDESIFENLRVNIPIETDPIFVLEQQGYDPVHLEAGYAYTWDTGLLHRAYAKEQASTPKHRTHLMLGFCCWWDFDEETRTWSQNEFFGRKHPLDMLMDGDVIPGLQIVQ